MAMDIPLLITYEYVDKIYNYQIPLVKMASKARVKATMVDYKRKMKNKAGNLCLNKHIWN
jgi:hypothetical protein